MHTSHVVSHRTIHDLYFPSISSDEIIFLCVSSLYPAIHGCSNSHAQLAYIRVDSVQVLFYTLQSMVIRIVSRLNIKCIMPSLKSRGHLFLGLGIGTVNFWREQDLKAKTLNPLFTKAFVRQNLYSG